MLRSRSHSSSQWDQQRWLRAGQGTLIVGRGLLATRCQARWVRLLTTRQLPTSVSHRLDACREWCGGDVLCSVSAWQLVRSAGWVASVFQRRCRDAPSHRNTLYDTAADTALFVTIFSSLSIFAVQLTHILPSFLTARAWCCPVPWLHLILSLVRMRKGEVEGVPNDYAAGEDYTITITSSVSGGLAHVFAASSGSIVSGGSYAMSASTGDCRGQDSRATSTEYVVCCAVLWCAVLCCVVVCCGL